MSVTGKKSNPKGSIAVLSKVLADLREMEVINKEFDRLDKNIYCNTKYLTDRIIPWIGANHPDWLEDSYTSVDEALSGDLEFDSISMQIYHDHAEIRIDKYDFDTDGGTWTDSYNVTMDDLIEALSGS